MATKITGLDIRQKRRPFVETEIYRDDSRRSGVQLRLSRAGVEVSGWYDTYVGIDSLFISWQDFDRLREELK